MGKVKITETVLRDAHQSLIATRMTMDEMLPILPLMDKVGYHSVECWGGATFDACLRFLNEDPWERLRTLKKNLPNTAFCVCRKKGKRAGNSYGVPMLQRRRGTHKNASAEKRRSRLCIAYDFNSIFGFSYIYKCNELGKGKKRWITKRRLFKRDRINFQPAENTGLLIYYYIIKKVKQGFF